MHVNTQGNSFDTKTEMKIMNRFLIAALHHTVTSRSSMVIIQTSRV